MEFISLWAVCIDIPDRMSLVTRLTENNESSLALFPVPMPSERTIYFSLTLESKTSKLSPEYSPLDEAEKLFISTVNFGISAKDILVILSTLTITGISRS